MATQLQLQPAIDAAYAADGAVLSEKSEFGVRYMTVGGALIGIVDSDAATLQADAQSLFDGDPTQVIRLIKAVAISNLAARLGKAPGALTAAELQAERDRIANIYKALT